MRDFARSDHPGVQAQLDRLGQLSVPDGRLGLETTRALLLRLGDPHTQLPPVFHVAGTNGKGSTCAFLSAMLEADGKRVHVTTSPHLVRYNERIRLAGRLIEDDPLAALLAEVLDAGEDLNPSFFEVTIAAAFLAFSREPADACVVEVGLGGRFDATNVLEPDVLAACGIAALGIDHERFLLAPEEGVPKDPISRIAFEKAGIAKDGVPLVTLSYDDGSTREIEHAVMRSGATLKMRGRNWNMDGAGAELNYSDQNGLLELPLPAMAGQHQAENAALAIAMLRHQDRIPVTPEALSQGMRTAQWPARMQRLADGPLAKQREVWLDGGHNRSAGEAIARHFNGQRVHLIIGMLDNKDPRALIDPMAERIASLTAVPIPTHASHPATAFGSSTKGASDVPAALSALPDDGLPVLIAGSLYLAGEVLRLNHQIPA
ncbi:bifunctional folylpolyglutamate synthase/dihydrofolate synthase [Parerythrobacter jejuensis]|uniref:Bifunctional folylpolyglutamate synthase/dihydrofolate synthase n=1 Tax=Parerythrobacter jejuensis TaxID=795812 RepID=A0A845AU06_9SPHN|nr:folylpolyglutamate synthase/dihydrofolate synthase family protein [Parerythrobacter jejuensis]MXP32643.1 bifunctional folylpolyglutamate synthase/dihydrofolate synthase [Parerythrobacter jejuensis]